LSSNSDNLIRTANPHPLKYKMAAETKAHGTDIHRIRADFDNHDELLAVMINQQKATRKPKPNTLNAEHKPIDVLVTNGNAARNHSHENTTTARIPDVNLPFKTGGSMPIPLH
jgi:hypothetical protein